MNMWNYSYEENQAIQHRLHELKIHYILHGVLNLNEKTFKSKILIYFLSLAYFLRTSLTALKIIFGTFVLIECQPSIDKHYL